jgi:hypothetical protein
MFDLSRKHGGRGTTVARTITQEKYFNYWAQQRGHNQLAVDAKE